MTRTRGGGERYPRLSLFVRSQLPVAASLAILRLVMLVFGIPVDHPPLLATGAVGVGLITLAALVLPWEKWPTRMQVIPATLDIVALTIVAIAMYGRLDTVGVLTALPAIWLAVVAGWPGVVLGVIGGYTASLLPLAVRPGDVGPSDWAAALVVPSVLSVAVVVARILTERYESAARSLQEATRERLAASAESARVGATLRSFAESVDVGMLYLDERGEPVIFNDALLRFGELARYNDDAGHGLRMFAADQVTPIPAEEQPLSRIRRGESIEGLLHWAGPRGAQRALIANGRQVHSPDGEFAGSIILIQDVTEVVRAGHEREDALATLAHELRTPLTSIVGYSDLLMSDRLSDEAAARVEVITRNAEHLLTLTSQFLDGLHRDASVQRASFVVSDAVEEAVDVMLTTPGFGEREVNVTVPVGLSVSADRDGVVAVLTNLLGNAVKFSRSCDRIEVEGGEDDEWVSLTVRNTGSHIDTPDLERIFDRFYRGGNAQRDAVAGTGIGLSVARDIAAAHGGTLTAEAVDEGASFRLCLPKE